MNFQDNSLYFCGAKSNPTRFEFMESSSLPFTNFWEKIGGIFLHAWSFSPNYKNF